MPTVGALLMAAGGLVGAYLLGAVPFGFLIGRARGVDIREVGSGNIGATNLGRACGKPWGVLAFFLDAGKGYLAAGPLAWLVLALGEAPAPGPLRAGLGPLYAAAAFGGHVWPVFLGFRGGKGVATGAGVLAALEPWALGAGMAVWTLVIVTVRYMSIASMLGALTVAGVAIWLAAHREKLGASWPLWGLTVALAVLVVARHRSNIARLLRGQEYRLGSEREAEKEKPT